MKKGDDVVVDGVGVVVVVVVVIGGGGVGCVVVGGGGCVDGVVGVGEMLMLPAVTSFSVEVDLYTITVRAESSPVQ